jgi:hypothetical protein
MSEPAWNCMVNNRGSVSALLHTLRACENNANSYLLGGVRQRFREVEYMDSKRIIDLAKLSCG